MIHIQTNIPYAPDSPTYNANVNDLMESILRETGLSLGWIIFKENNSVGLLLPDDKQEITGELSHVSVSQVMQDDDVLLVNVPQPYQSYGVFLLEKIKAIKDLDSAKLPVLERMRRQHEATIAVIFAEYNALRQHKNPMYKHIAATKGLELMMQKVMDAEVSFQGMLVDSLAVFGENIEVPAALEEINRFVDAPLKQIKSPGDSSSLAVSFTLKAQYYTDLCGDAQLSKEQIEFVNTNMKELVNVLSELWQRYMNHRGKNVVVDTTKPNGQIEGFSITIENIEGALQLAQAQSALADALEFTDMAQYCEVKDFCATNVTLAPAVPKMPKFAAALAAQGILRPRVQSAAGSAGPAEDARLGVDLKP